jgi:hypothetical protein
MSVMVFNAHQLFCTAVADLPDVGDDWPVDDWKYADVGFVYNRTTDLIRKIIDAAPVSTLFKRVLIDVKVQDLVPNVCSCLPGWHIDGAFPLEGTEPDRHHLFVMNGPLTEFIAHPVMIDVKRPVDMTAIVSQIRPDVDVTTCAPNAITSFTSLDFHRGVKAARPTRRLLVRLTETNTVLAHNKPKRPHVGGRK